MFTPHHMQNPDDVTFNPVEDPQGGNDHLSGTRSGFLRNHSSGLREIH